MKQCGRVVRIEGDRLTVFPDGARCAGCSGGHCHVAGRTVQVSNSEGLPVRVADRVEITTGFWRGLTDFSLVILLPLAAALGAAFPLADLLGLESGAAQSLLAISGAGLLLGANLLRSPEKRGRSLPRLSAVLAHGPGGAGGPGSIVSPGANS